MTGLTDRYVGAALRSIPERQRADIEAELRASIGDAVEAKVDNGEEARSAEKEVLTALGDPDRLAAGYTGRPGYLIGPEHFFDYKRLLTVLLITVVPIVMAVTAAIQVIAGEDVGSVIGEAIGLGISLVVHIGFWTTLIFHFVERSDQEIGAEWSVERLPALPTAGSIKLGETITSVVFLVFAITAIFLSRNRSPITAADGNAIPIFAPSMWGFWFPFLIGVLVAEIVFEVVKYRVGRWTRGLASVNLALNVLFAIPAVYLLATDRMFNPEFVAELPAAVPDFTWVITAAIVITTLVDAIQGFRRAYQAR